MMSETNNEGTPESITFGERIGRTTLALRTEMAGFVDNPNRWVVFPSFRREQDWRREWHCYHTFMEVIQVYFAGLWVSRDWNSTALAFTIWESDWDHWEDTSNEPWEVPVRLSTLNLKNVLSISVFC